MEEATGTTDDADGTAVGGGGTVTLDAADYARLVAERDAARQQAAAAETREVTANQRADAA